VPVALVADFPLCPHAAGMTADGLTLALEDYQRAQDELVEARNRLARAIAGAPCLA
jgi:trimethylamine:corrinoid methyltransferase-like protein